MLAMEEVLSELNGDEVNEQGLPPGFRFHPTDEELITFYLASKVFNGTFCGVEIAEVDLNRCEPWELPDVAKMGEKEWYFFSLRDRKYPTGLRTNRATGAGYWKATGKDREVYSGSSGALLGMKKTLVFYKGRAPRGEKTKWVMHEYRLDGDFSYRHTCKEEWVICRIFNKAVVSGEKKNGLLLQGQNYLFEAAAATAGAWLPALLDAPGPATTTLLLECQSQNHNPILENLPNHFVNQQQDNHHHHLFPVNGLFETSAVTNKHILMNNNTENIGNNTSPSMLFKALLSHQDFSCCDELATSPKHCKTEANFSHIQLPPATAAEDNNNDNRSNCYWMDSKIQPNPYSNPLFSEFDCSFPGLTQPSAFASTAVNDTSTSIAFNRTGFQVIEKSWPLDA